MKTTHCLVWYALFFVCLISRQTMAQDIIIPAAASGTKEFPQVVFYANGSITAPDITKPVSAFGGAGLGFILPRTQFLFEMHRGMDDRVGARYDVSGHIHAASRSDYGHALLASAGRISYELKTFWHSKNDLFPELFPRSHIRWTISMNAMRSDGAWTYSGAAARALESVDETTLSFAACSGLMNRRQLAGQLVTVFIHPCMSFRSIEGNVAESANDGLRASLIGTGNRAFVIPELHVGFQVENVELSVRASYAFGGGGVVNGLSGFHIIPTILGSIPVGFHLF